ncbi:hypothetical protein [Bradyrhizobium sp. AUGA SZCCT0222]|nr:hypothetical protein [Bradyrhizobium sp. AUGA SZCCT0222]
MRKIVGFVLLALLAVAAMHPNNRYHPPAATSHVMNAPNMTRN